MATGRVTWERVAVVAKGQGRSERVVVATGRVTWERAEAEATGQGRSERVEAATAAVVRAVAMEVVVMVAAAEAEATGRVNREREEAEVTGQAKAEAEAAGDMGSLRLPTCFARVLLQGATAVFDWLVLVGARSVRGGA